MRHAGRRSATSVLLATLLALPVATPRAAPAGQGPGEDAAVGAAATFHDAWFREVVQGDLEDAARAYASIYERGRGPEAARWAVRAAWRAGRCYELLDEQRLAELAYRWIDEEKDAVDPALRRRARTRLAVLAGEAPAPEAARGPVPMEAPPDEGAVAPVPEGPSGDPDLRDALVDLRGAAVRRGDLFRRLASGLREARQRVRAADRVRRALDRRGVELTFPATVPHEALVERVEARLEEILADAKAPGDTLRRALEARFLERGLQAASSGDLPRGRRDLGLARALRSASDEIAERSGRLDGTLEGDAAPRLAARRLEELRREDAATLRRALRTQRRRAAESRRRDLALGELFGGLETLEWAPGHARSDPEVAELAAGLRRELVLVASGSPATARFLVRLAAWRQAETRRALERAEDWAVLVAEEARRRVPERTGPRATPRRTAWAFRRELAETRKLLATEGTGGEGDAGEASARQEAARRRLRWLERWFPEGVAPLARAGGLPETSTETRKERQR